MNRPPVDAPVWRPAPPPQAQLWRLHALDPRRADHFVPLALRYDGVAPTRLLEQALGEIVRRHAVLRWQFRSDRGDLQVAERPFRPVRVAVVDAPREWLDDQRLVTKAVQAIVARPFALDAYPLYRFVHVRAGASARAPRADDGWRGGGVIAGVLHHTIADGWSMGVLAAELEELWRSFAIGRASPLAPLPLQYLDRWYGAHGEARLADAAAHLRFWTDRLRGLDAASSWPAMTDADSAGSIDRARPRAGGAKPKTRRLWRRTDAIEADESARLRRLAGAHRASPFAIFAACLSIVQSRLGGRGAAVIGADAAGRGDPAIERLIGFFINVLPLRLDVDPRARFTDHLDAVRDVLLAAHAHQDVSFEAIVHAVAPARTGDRNPLFNVKLMLHNFSTHRLRAPGVSLTPLPIALEGSSEALRLFIRPVTAAPADGIAPAASATERFALDWDARADLVSSTALDAVAGAFRRVMRQALAAPGTRVRDFMLADTDAASHDESAGTAAGRARRRAGRAAGGEEPSSRSRARLDEAALRAADAESVGDGRLLDAWLQPVVPGGIGELYEPIGSGTTITAGDPAAVAAAYVPSPSGLGARLRKTGRRAWRLDDRRIVFVRRDGERLDAAAPPTSAPATTAAAAAAHEQPVGDTSALALALARRLVDLIGAERPVGPHDDFFALGGDSLIATRLAFAIEEEYGVECAVADIFERRTPAQIAAHVAALARETAAPAAPLTRASRHAPLPVAGAQRRLLFLSGLDPRDTAYHCGASLELRGRPSVPLLRQALREVSRRQDALRTVFPLIDGELRQDVLPHAPLIPVEVDVSGVAAPRAGLLRERLRRAALRRPIALRRSPACRALLIDIGGGARELAVTMHHVISDAWSQQILVRELTAAATAHRAGLPSPLPPLPFQYADYACWQEQRLQGAHLARLGASWAALAVDADFTPIDFTPIDVASSDVASIGVTPIGITPIAVAPGAHGPLTPTVDAHGSSRANAPVPVASRRVGYRRFVLLPALRRKLEAVARSRGVTMNVLLLTAFQLVLHRLTGRERLALIASAAHRYPREMQDVVGFFAHNFPVASRWRASDTVFSLLDRTRAYMLEALRLEELPFDRIVDVLRQRRDADDPSRLNVSFVMLPVQDDELRLPGIDIRHVAVDDEAPRFDVELQIHLTSRTLAATVAYSAAPAPAARIDALVADYLATLDRLTNPAGSAARPVLAGLRRPVAAAVPVRLAKTARG